MAIKTDNLINLSGSLSVPIDTVVQGSAKAWVNFNGTGTVAIRASFNVSSITDNGVGDYTVNFTNAMVDANYVVSMCNVVGWSANGIVQSQQLTSSCRVSTRSWGSAGTSYDEVQCLVSINR